MDGLKNRNDGLKLLLTVICDSGLWNEKKKIKWTHVRLASGVEDLEVDHVVVHDSVECVDLLQSGVVLPDKPACDEAHHQRCNIAPSVQTTYNIWVNT